MKQLAILSGKGGTGKTMVAAGLATMAARAGRVVLVDADVDAANLELILRPDILQAADFSGGKRAVIDAHACTACGRCASACRFEAVEQQGGAYRVDAMACEGCAACAYQCPTGAIQMQDSPSGQWFRSETRVGPLVHARLQPGEQNSGKLVSRIRQEAVAWGTECRADWVLIDGSPGIGCPVIAAATGADQALLVAEPTVSGLHDLERVLAVVGHFRLPAAVCINKCDINLRMAQEIVHFCTERQVPVWAQLPYSEVVLEAMRRELAVTELPENPVARGIRQLWAALRTV
jgi:MinD superfamily P-loop ATPase